MHKYFKAPVSRDALAPLALTPTHDSGHKAIFTREGKWLGADMSKPHLVAPVAKALGTRDFQVAYVPAEKMIYVRCSL